MHRIVWRQHKTTCPTSYSQKKIICNHKQVQVIHLFTLFKIHKYGGNTNSYRTDKLAWLPQKYVEPKAAMGFKMGENQMKTFTQEVANVPNRWQGNKMTRPAFKVH